MNNQLETIFNQTHNFTYYIEHVSGSKCRKATLWFHFYRGEEEMLCRFVRLLRKQRCNELYSDNILDPWESIWRCRTEDYMFAIKHDKLRSREGVVFESTFDRICPIEVYRWMKFREPPTFMKENEMGPDLYDEKWRGCKDGSADGIRGCKSSHDYPPMVSYKDGTFLFDATGYWACYEEAYYNAELIR